MPNRLLVRPKAPLLLKYGGAAAGGLFGIGPKAPSIRGNKHVPFGKRPVDQRNRNILKHAPLALADGKRPFNPVNHKHTSSAFPPANRNTRPVLPIVYLFFIPDQSLHTSALRLHFQLPAILALKHDGSVVVGAEHLDAQLGKPVDDFLVRVAVFVARAD